MGVLRNVVRAVAQRVPDHASRATRSYELRDTPVSGYASGRYLPDHGIDPAYEGPVIVRFSSGHGPPGALRFSVGPDCPDGMPNSIGSR
jgi:hypothetical protein